MQAGKLDRRVVLQRFTETRDEYNEPVQTWATLATRSASFEPLSDGERLRSGQVGATATARFVIRYSTAVADLDAKDRLTFDGDTYAILHVKPLGRREGLEITATARAD